MLVSFGKHKGKTVARLVTKEADYVKWVLGQPDATGGLARLRSEMIRLIHIFDSKPIIGTCYHRGCERPPTRFSAYVGAEGGLFAWCDLCDPYEAGAFPGRLAIVRSYKDGLQHVESTCEGRKAGYRAIIREMAIRKGLPKRSGEAALDGFFA